jgi:5,10-methylenetetrahydromethanopterin reductase
MPICWKGSRTARNRTVGPEPPAVPIDVPLWLSVMGPRGNERAPEVADGIIGPPHPRLPSATMLTGTALDEGESPCSARVLEAVGPWGVVPWHTACH